MRSSRRHPTFWSSSASAAGRQRDDDPFYELPHDLRLCLPNLQHLLMRHRRSGRSSQRHPRELIRDMTMRYHSKRPSHRVTYLGLELLSHALPARTRGDPNDHISDQAEHEDPSALIAPRDDLRDRAHPHHARARSSQQRRLPARLVRGPTHPCVRPLRQRRPAQVERVRRAERRQPQRP